MGCGWGEEPTIPSDTSCLRSNDRSLRRQQQLTFREVNYGAAHASELVTGLIGGPTEHEVLATDPYKNLSEGLTSAFFVGQSHVVGDTVTDIVAIANDNVQAEIWIGVDDGLPRMIRAVYPKDPTQSRYEIQFSNWHLNQPTKDADFTSAQALKAPRMQFARPDAPVPAKP